MKPGPLDSASWSVLSEVSKSAVGLHVFTIHRRLTLSALQLGKIIGDLSESGYVLSDSDGMHLRITKLGYVALQAGNPSKLQPSAPANASPAWIWRQRIEVNSPYAPRVALFFELPRDDVLR